MLIPGCFRIGCSSATIFRRTDADEERDEARQGFSPKRSREGTGREQNPHEFYLLKAWRLH